MENGAVLFMKPYVEAMLRISNHDIVIDGDTISYFKALQMCYIRIIKGRPAKPKADAG